MNKPRYASPLSVAANGVLSDGFKRQGFASAELVVRWTEIVGAEIAAHAEPVRIQWRRRPDGEPEEPATLVLRVEGPAALEVQHLSNVVIERVNRFFGWQAVGRLALRQAPLSKRPRRRRPEPDPRAAAEVAAGLGDIVDERLRLALGRLGAAVKQT